MGRNSSGVPTSSQNLGTTALPWGTLRVTTIILNGSAVDVSQITRPQNVITSGKKRSTSNQPAFITPNGSALSLIVAGATTNLVYDVNGTSVSATTDITKSGLTAAPSSNNTCLVDDALAADQVDTRLWGEPEHTKVITIDNIGSSISALNGKYAAFKLDNGSSTEYFIALVDTSNNRLHKCRRGYFYDSSLNPKNRIFFSNNDTITLLKWGFLFAENNGTTVDVSYTVPHYGFEAPSSPATGDYWHDQANKMWKRYDGASFQIISRTLIGSFVSDSTNTIGARCEPFYAKYSDENSLFIELSTTEIVRGSKPFGKVNVAGNLIEFGNTMPLWNITTDLATSVDMYDATEQASRLYYLYLKDTGDAVISDISPYYDSFGAYHPHNPWRLVGGAYNSSGSDLTTAGGANSDANHEVWLYTANGYGSTNTYIRRWTTVGKNIGSAITYADSAGDGGSFTINEAGLYSITYVDQFTSDSNMGISLNSNQLTTDIATITATHRLLYTHTPVANVPTVAAITLYLNVGDVIRGHTAAVASGGSPNGETFRIARVA